MTYCGDCIYNSLHQMIDSNQPYGYSGDIPCLRCIRWVKLRDEFVPKNDDPKTL